MVQSPEEFFSSLIPADVRNDPKYKDRITTNLDALKNNGGFLTDSQQISALYQRGLRDDARAASTEKIEAVRTISTLFQAIGIESNKKDLVTGAQLLSAGTQLYSSYVGFSAAMATSATVATTATTTAATATAATTTLSAASVALPVATAALALYSIYNALKSKKPQDNTFADAMMKNFGILNANVLNGFHRCYGYHEQTIQLLDHGFRDINESQHTLFKQGVNTQMNIVNMHIDISNELKKLTWYVHALGDTLIEGQERISLQGLSDLLNRSEKIASGDIDANPDAIQEIAYKLAEWSKLGGTASDPFYTGIKYVAKIRHRPSEFPELYAIINQAINPFYPDGIKGSQGLLAYIVKSQLLNNASQTVNVGALFNPNFFIKAAYRYVNLRRQHPQIVRDANNITINSIIASADNQLAWTREKRHSAELYQAVFTLLENATQGIREMLNSQIALSNQSIKDAFTGKHPNATAVNIDLSLSTDELINNFSNLFPINPNCIGETSVQLIAPLLLSDHGLCDYMIRGAGCGGIPMHLWPNGPIPDHWGYHNITKQQPLYNFPLTVEKEIFVLAEHLGLISLKAFQIITYRKPKETPGQLIGLYCQGSSVPLDTIHAYEADEIYTLKATLNGTEHIIQEHHFLRNTRENTNTLISTTTIDNIDAFAAQIRTLVDNFLKERKKLTIMRLFTDASLKHVLNDDLLAAINASIRLLSALMSDWPGDMRSSIVNAIHNSELISQYLKDEATHSKSWQEIINGLVQPQYENFKNTILEHTQHPDSDWEDDEYTALIKKLHGDACDIRDNSPAVVNSMPASPVPVQDLHEVHALRQEISELKQMMYIVMQQNAFYIQELQKNARSNTTGAPSLTTFSPGSSSSSGTPSNRNIIHEGRK